MFHTTFKVQFLTLAELGSDCDLFERSRPLSTYSPSGTPCSTKNLFTCK